MDSLDVGSPAAVLLCASLLYLSYRFFKPHPLDVIPTVGPTGWFATLRSTYRFFVDSGPMLQEGYEKHRGHAFKIATVTRYDVVVNGTKLVDELHRAPDDVLSFHSAGHEQIQTQYTLGLGIMNNEYHIPLVRSKLTKSLNALLPAIYDEIVSAYGIVIPVKDDAWTTINSFDSVMDCVCRISNRAFVGLPKCRDLDWLELNKTFTIDLVKAAVVIQLFPSFLRPLVAPFLTRTITASINRGVKHMQPVIEERRRQLEAHDGDWPEKPNDMLTWCMEEAQGEEQSIRNLTLRMLTLNFAAIHTSSMTFTHALLHLAANPEYIQPLREEFEQVVREHGWTKAGIRHMHKIDSFLRESQRMNAIDGLSLKRKALTDFTFSDGTFIPKGTYVSAAARPTQYDDAIYPEADRFDPFRFAALREEPGEVTKHQFVSTSVEYMPFGHGRHACPGRFFAGQELALMLGHLVANYDLKLASGTERPPNRWLGTSCLPANAPVMFRKRQD